MSSPLVALILGAGPNIGTAVAGALSKAGYSIALASRSGTGTKNDQGHLNLKADFSNPISLPLVFEQIKAEYNTAPAVVIYNAATLTPPPNADELFSLPADAVAKDFNVNTISPYVAAQQAVLGWETLAADTKKTFIYTGNALNQQVIPVGLFLTLGAGKSASAFWIGLADALYAKRGYRFFYADERNADGSAMTQGVDGPAHAGFFTELVKHEGSIPWDATFVKDKGHVEFK